MSLFQVKTWQESPNPLTPVSAAALNDLEARISAGQVGAPNARVHHSTTNNTTSGTWKIMAWDTEDWDSANEHDNATNNSRLTANVAGVYYVTALADWPAGAGGASRHTEILKNSGGTGGAGTFVALSTLLPAANSQRGVAAGPIKLAIGDYVETHVYQDSGAGMNIAATFSFMAWHYLGAG